ncbi:ZnMc MMP [Drosophila suzukii associated hytrosavirus 1]|nr:ZnMc MMP [Drosophila suzukii associated hytrosavirus 1]
MCLNNRLIVVIILLVIIITVYTYRPNKDQNVQEIYMYEEEDFPLNVYFFEKTMKNEKFPTLYKAVDKAITRFNSVCNFEFFKLNGNVSLYPNIVMVQIACGSHYGCLAKFDEEGGILAHATYPPHRKVCIDCKDINFQPLDVVLQHELGHIIGLSHTKQKGVSSLMNPFITKDVNNFTEYDTMRIRKIYTFLK